MTVHGGLRRRLIHDNLFYMIQGSMDQLGWFGTTFAKKSVELLPEPVDSREEILPNKVSLSAEDMVSMEFEVGSYSEQNNCEYYIDIFAEDEAVGNHLSGDLYDILRGKYGSIGRTRPTFEVYDLTNDGQPFLFTCYIEEIEKQRVREWENPQSKYWWVIGFMVVDYQEGAE